MERFITNVIKLNCVINFKLEIIYLSFNNKILKMLVVCFVIVFKSNIVVKNKISA